MSPQEKEDYFRWVAVLKRTRGRRGNTKHFKLPSRLVDSEVDARDEIAKFDDVNNPPQKTPGGEETFEDAENVEFYQIYSKLVSKIRSRLEKPELPSIDNKR